MGVTDDETTSPARNSAGTVNPKRRKSSGRSKSGCLTCRGRRVKCDETRPVCQRCSRLSLDCAWSPGVPALAKRRRGLGPLKSRMLSDWKPAPILPAYSDDQISVCAENNSTCHVNGTHTDPGLITQTDFSLTEDPRNGHSTYESTRCFSPWANQFFNTIVSTISQQVETSDPDIESGHISSWEQPVSPDCMGLQQCPAPENISFIDLAYEMQVDTVLSWHDRRAIEYYTSEFSHVHITKRFTWSTNALLLRLGYEQAVVMRFLLAASLNELHRKDSNSDINLKQMAEIHFQSGCNLFSQLVTQENQSSIDHRPVLASVFFSYLYLSRRKYVDRLRIRSLSRITSEYIRKHSLHVLGSPSRDSTLFGASPAPTTDNSIESPIDKRLIGQLMRWNFFKDVQMAFHGCGGNVASHIIGTVRHYDGLRRVSNSLANNIWGNSYPESEVIDDLQNAAATDCLYQVFIIMQDVNEYSSKTEPDPVYAQDIERNLQKLERKYQALFLLSPSKTVPRTPMLINVDLTISRFYATRIYFFRAGQARHPQCPPGGGLPVKVQNSLAAILAIAHGMFASQLLSPYERLQWPLFMVGIETQDVIHREWVLSHMRPSALKTSLSRVIKAQDYLGYRLEMITIKDIIKDVDRNVAEGNYPDVSSGQNSDSWVDVEDQNDFCLW